MASKILVQINADQVDADVLWKALTKDLFEVASKATPGLFKEWKISEGDENGNLTLNSILHITLGNDASHVEPLKQKVTVLDEANHLVSFEGTEGGYLNLGLTSYVLSFKIDTVEGKTIVTATLAHELDKDFDGFQHVEGFTLLVKNFLSSVVSHLQLKNIV